MTPLKIVINQEFIDREHERTYLMPLLNSAHSSILIIYGRRRVGKKEGVDINLKNQAYFDQVLTLDDLFV